jgi:hypothetical protein
MDGRLPVSGLGLTHGFDDETLMLKRGCVGLERTVDAREFQLEAGVLTAPWPGFRLEVRGE